MKRILINDANLEGNDMDYSVVRVKGIIINSNNEVILIENNNTFQFPGGHNRKGESLEETLEREIKEELGIELKVDTGPFMMITTFDNNYFNSGQKVCNKIYYYVVKSDKEPDLNNLCLDEIESKTDFNVYKIKSDQLENFLNKSLVDGNINKTIAREMLLVYTTYYDMFGGRK